MLFLAGGGDIKRSYELDQVFIESLTGNAICYIPLARKPELTGYESSFDWFTAMLAAHGDNFFDVVMVTKSEQLKKVKLDTYDALYLGGGNTYQLRDMFFCTGFAKKIEDYFSSGGIIYGGSAGAIVLGKSLATVKNENILNSINGDDGIGLIENYSVLCHYSNSKDQQIKEFIQRHDTPLIALPEGAGLILEPNSNKLVSIGQEPLYIFYGTSRKIVPAGTSYPIQRSTTKPQDGRA